MFARLLALSLFISAWGLFAQAQMPVAIVWDGGATSGSYQGPIDLVASPIACYSTRACSAATRGTKAMNVCNVSDIACADFSTDATTGKLVVTTVGGSSCSVITCTVKTWYDQSGNVNDCIQATIANRPTLVVSGLNSLPILTFVSASICQTASNVAVGAPQTTSAVAERTGSFTTFVQLLGTLNGALDWNNTANTVLGFTTTDFVTRTAADNAWHRIQWAITAAFTDGNLFIDNSVGSDTVLTGHGNTAQPLKIGSSGAAFNLAEDILWPVATATVSNHTNADAIDLNQKTFWAL